MDFAIVCRSWRSNNKAEELGEKIAEMQENRNEKGKNVLTFEAPLNIYSISKSIKFVNVKQLWLKGARSFFQSRNWNS